MWRFARNLIKEVSLCCQMIKTSSKYRFISRGFVDCVFKNFLMVTDMKIFAIVGENGAPLAVPCICWKTVGPNSIIDA